MSAQILDAEKVIATIGILKNRITNRFPDSGLANVCGELLQISEQTTKRAEWIASPIWWVKWLIVIFVGLILILGLILPFVLKLGFSEDQLTVRYVLESAEPVMNEIVLIGAVFFFLFTLETRIKRHRALKAIHELRSIAHIIDMHQLTKDPERIVSAMYIATDASPKATMDRFQLRRYLDYCSEMLSLTGKLAALLVQNFDDAVALASVNEVESLTTGLSRKIWQKIMILHTVAPTELEGTNSKSP